MSENDYSTIALAAGVFVTKRADLFSEAVVWWNENWGRAVRRRDKARQVRRLWKEAWNSKRLEDETRRVFLALGPDGESYLRENPARLPSARCVNSRVRDAQSLPELELHNRLSEAACDEFLNTYDEDGGHSMSLRDALRILLMVAVDRHPDYAWRSLLQLDERPSDTPRLREFGGFLWDHLVKVAWQMTQHLRQNAGVPLELNSSEDDVEPPYYIDLNQAAALVNRSKRTLERRRREMPKPAIKGKGGKKDEWLWMELRPWLEEKYGRKLPDRPPHIAPDRH